MRVPTADSLVKHLKIDRPTANLVRRVAKACDDADALRAIVEKHCPATARYVRSMYSSPYTSQMWRTTVALHAIDAAIGTYGIEALGPCDDRGFDYLNTGDTYAATLVYRRSTSNLYVSSMGDVVERYGRAWQ